MRKNKIEINSDIRFIYKKISQLVYIFFKYTAIIILAISSSSTIKAQENLPSDFDEYKIANLLGNNQTIEDRLKPYVTRLNLWQHELNDEGLSNLKGLKNLSKLYLRSEKITDSGLIHLTNLENLSELILSRTKINGSGLIFLKDLTRLSALDISYSNLNDDGVSHLKNFNNLSVLDITSTKITDTGVSYLAGLTNLSKLDLGQSQSHFQWEKY